MTVSYIFAEGICRYHASRLQSAGSWTYKYTCCGKTSRDYDSARSLPGCTKGKHRSKHHTEYPYAAYYFYMNKLVRSVVSMCITMVCSAIDALHK